VRNINRKVSKINQTNPITLYQYNKKKKKKKKKKKEKKTNQQGNKKEKIIIYTLNWKVKIKQ